MICEILGWLTIMAIVLMTGLVSFALYETGRYPTAWANRIVAPGFADDEFIVYGDDTVGLY